jgi:hypothetical protein
MQLVATISPTNFEGTEARFSGYRLDALVMEGRDRNDLTFFYRISDPKGSYLLVPPGVFTMGGLQCVDLVDCDHHTCNASWMQIMQYNSQVEQGWRFDIPVAVRENLPEKTEACCIWTPYSSSEFGRVAAFATCFQSVCSPTPSFEQWPVLRKGERLPCCIEYANGLAEKRNDGPDRGPVRRIFHFI